MKRIILICSLLAILASCATSRKENTFRQTSSLTSLQVDSSTSVMERLLSELAAHFSDSVHVIARTYYPPSDSDSIGPVKGELVYHRSSESAVKDTELKQKKSEDSLKVDRNSISSMNSQTEIQKKSPGMKFGLVHLIFVVTCLIVLFRVLKHKQ